jgi:RHS repeat-associated protein
VVRDDGTKLVTAEQIDAKGRYTTVRFGNGVVEGYDYSQYGREDLLSWSASTASGSYGFENLELDGAGRLLWERQSTPDDDHVFLCARRPGRLTDTANSSSWIPQVEKYTHDPLGNLLTRDGTTGITSLAYTSDTADPDRLCRASTPGTSGPCQFSYDGAGNVVIDSSGAEVRKFNYDPAHRLLDVSRGASTVHLQHGPVGRAHTHVVAPTGERDIWHFGLIEERWQPGSKHIEREIPGPLGVTVSLRSEVINGSVVDDTVVYAHGDGRANRVFTGPDGTVVQAATYGTFGQTSTTGNSSSLTQSDDLWNGGDNFPEVGVVILGPRAYDPELGRFLQRDPISVSTRSSTANPYAFAFANPVDFSDPSGLTPYMGITKSTPGQSTDWRPALTAAAGFLPFVWPLIWSDRTAEPLAGVGATGFETWLANSGMFSGGGGGACDDALCSTIDSGLSAGLFWTPSSPHQRKIQALPTLSPVPGSSVTLPPR